jgi:hypothetical protein
VSALPEIITHNYDPSRGPFRNICNLASTEAEQILDQIRASGLRRIRSNYLERRLATERWLYAECSRKLGVPLLRHPVYFFLGDFADGQDPSRPQSIVTPLSAFAPEVITFTYPDSMASLPLATDEALAAHRMPYHGQVFTLPGIREVVSRFGLPRKRIPAEPPSGFDQFIEVQIWSNAPLESLRARSSFTLPSPAGGGESVRRSRS